MLKTTNMDPDMSKRLFQGGATVVFLDTPQNTEVGIDMNVWRTGDRFKGLKMIPPGLHMLHYSAVGKDSIAAPRTSFFYIFEGQEVLVRKWNATLETMMKVLDPEEEMRVTENKQELEKYLGAFPYDTWKKWYSLTSYVSDELVKQVEPMSEVLCSASQLVLDDEQDILVGAASVSAEENVLPKMHLKSGTELRFTKLPSLHCLVDTTPEFKTKYSLDSSCRLEMMLQLTSNPDYLLGELQIAFVTFLVGHVFESFEHWKQLVHMFCTCDEALRKYPDFFCKFLSCLHYQIEEVPEDFFTDIISKENFLVYSLHILFSNIEQVDVPHVLKEKGVMFRNHLVRKFKWDFTDEPDEFAPTVVDIS